MKRKVLLGCFLVVMFLTLGVAVSAGADTIGWESTFDTVDSLDDWVISHGNCTVDEAQGTLVGGADCYSGGSVCLSYLWRNSTAMTGTWSFDILLPGNATFFIFYYVGISAIADGSHPEAGYTFIIQPPEIKINYRYSSSNRGNLDSHVPADGIVGWQHFDIARNDAGKIWVCLNGTKILEATDTYHTSSEKINIQLEPGVRMDNISYKPEVSDPTTTTTTTSTIASTIASTGLDLLVVVPPLLAVIATRKKNRNS
ncbi:MAG: hypothetical protein ACFFD4_33590 [Candidatus Odinarchaeota archaeon]